MDLGAPRIKILFCDLFYVVNHLCMFRGFFENLIDCSPAHLKVTVNPYFLAGENFHDILLSAQSGN